MRISKVPSRASTATAMGKDPGKVLTITAALANSLPARPTRTRKSGN